MDDFTALAAARTALESRDWQEAARLYTSVLEHGRSQAEALHGLGVVALLGRRDAKTARSLFEAAVARAPNDANSLYRLGEIAETESDRDAALERYRQVLALAPNHAAARSRLGALAQPAHTPQAAAPDTPETHAASGTMSFPRFSGQVRGC